MSIRTRELEVVVRKLGYNLPYTVARPQYRWGVEKESLQSVMVYELMALTYRQALSEVVRMAFKDNRFTKNQLQMIGECLNNPYL